MTYRLKILMASAVELCKNFLSGNENSHTFVFAYRAARKTLGDCSHRRKTRQGANCVVYF
jgi:hypothetical protein